MYHFKHVLQYPDAPIMTSSGIFCFFDTSSLGVARVKHGRWKDKHTVKVDRTAQITAHAQHAVRS